MTNKDDRLRWIARLSRRPLGAEVIEKFKCFILILATDLLNATEESYPNVMMRAFGISAGNKSRSHKQLFSCSHVLYASPCNPWTATTSIVFSLSFVDSSNIPIFLFEILPAHSGNDKIWIVSSTAVAWLTDVSWSGNVGLSLLLPFPNHFPIWVLDIWAPNVWRSDCHLITHATVAGGDPTAQFWYDISKFSHHICKKFKSPGKAESGAVADFAPLASLRELSESETKQLFVVTVESNPTMLLWPCGCSWSQSKI